jgi:hypothetical protein
MAAGLRLNNKNMQLPHAAAATIAITTPPPSI